MTKRENTAQDEQLKKLPTWDCKRLILKNQNNKELIDKILALRPELKAWFDMTIPRQYKMKEKAIMCPNCALPFSVAR